MPSVNDPEFLDLFHQLLLSDSHIPELETLIEEGLDLDEKVREFIYRDDEWDEFNNTRVYTNKSVLFLALSRGSSELIHFLIGRCIPGREEIEFCAQANTNHLSDLEYVLENRKFLEEMLKRYEGGVFDYSTCVNHLELFVGFGLLDLGQMVRRQISLLPIEHQMVRYIWGFIGLENTLLLHRAGSPPVCFERVRQAASRRGGMTPVETERYKELIEKVNCL